MTPPLEGFFLQLAKRFRLAAVAALGLLLMLSLQVRPPTFSGSMVKDIAGSNPQMRAAEQIAAARGYTETIVLVVEAGDAAIGDAFAGVENLLAALAGSGFYAELRSVHDLREQLFLFGLSSSDPLADLLEILRQDDSAEPLVSNDGLLFTVTVTVAADEEKRALTFIRRHDFGSGFEHIAVLAAAALEQDVASGLQKDLRLLIPAIVLVMLGTLLIAFGHWRALLLPVFASLASSTVVFSLLSVTQISINLVTLLALPIVLIVALANSCHFLAKSATALNNNAIGDNTPRDRTGGSNDDLDDAVALTLARVALPYLASCLTTAVALASLGLNEIGPIRDLGLLSCASLLVSFLLILLFAPLALRWHLAADGHATHVSPAFQAFSRLMRRNRRPVAAVLLGAATISLFAAPSVHVRSDARLFFPDDAPFTQAFRAFEDRFFVFTPMQVLIREADSAATSLHTLQFAGRIREALRNVDGVLHAEMAAALEGGGFLITALVAREPVAADLVRHLDRLRADNRGAYDVIYSSGQLVFESIDQQALSSLVTSLLVTLVIVFAAIALLFRSLRTLAAATLANAVPLSIVFGVVWLVGDPLNLVTAFVFLVALGVIVDDTIHILYRYRSGATLAGSSIEFSVLLSTVMLCAGLALCQLSDFPTTRQFAMYFALAVAAALGSDLTLLPALLGRRKAGAAD